MKRQALIFLLLMVFLIWRFSGENEPVLPDGAKIRVYGFLTGEPDISGNNQIFTLRSIKIKARQLPEYHLGDYLEIVGKLEVRPLNNFFNEYWLIYPEIERIEMLGSESAKSFWYFPILKKVNHFRVAIKETYNKSLPEPFSSLLLGIVLGIKSQLPKKFFEAIRASGTLHVVVASGMNLTLWTPSLINILSGLFNRFLVIFISLIGMFFYCAMVGFEPPIVRAAIMVGLAYLAMLLGRRKDGVVVLLLSAAIMLVWDPRLLFSLSFQLSFTATGGIMFLEPMFRGDKGNQGDIGSKGDRGERERRGWLGAVWQLFTGDFLTTLSAQIGVMPILVANFGEVSVISLLVNCLVLWTIPYLMGLGMLLALVGFIWSFLAKVVALMAWPFLFWFVKVVGFFGGLPLASVQVPKIPFWGVMVYYLVLGYFVWRKWGIVKNV